MAFAGDVMAASTVSATAFLGTVLSVAIRRTLLVAVHAGPAPGTHALAVERIARGPVPALTIHLAISAPFTQRAPCSYKVKNKLPRVCRLNRLFISVGAGSHHVIFHQFFKQLLDINIPAKIQRNFLNAVKMYLH